MCGWLAVFYPAAASEPIARVKTKAIKDLGVIAPPSYVQGRDGGYSVWFDNHSIWIFGDTLFKGKPSQAIDMQANSWSWTADRDASDGIGPFYQPRDAKGLPMLLLPFTDAEKAFNATHAEKNCKEAPCGVRWALWPGAIVADPIHNRMLLFYEKLYIEPGELNYKIMGSSMTSWNNIQEQPQRMEFEPGHEPGVVSRDSL